jgi:hypothetical protein
MKEQELHTAVVKYLNWMPNILFTSTLGGIYLGNASWNQKRILKTHYKKGVPDILIFEPRNDYNGLMIELKTTKGKTSIHQKEWIDKLNDRKYMAVVCRGFKDAIDTIDLYFKK